MTLRNLVSRLKFAVFGRATRVRSILAGAASGLRMEIDPSAKTQRLLGLDEREIQSEFVRFSRWADTLVDVGSSDAYYGLIFHKHNAAGSIHLIDANRDFAPIQRRHFALNFPNATIDARTAFVTPPEQQSEGTLCISRDLPLTGRRVFLKIDVDGWELDVLRSAEDLLSKTPCRLLIETHSPELERACIEFLETRGYRTRIIRNAWWRRFIPELRPLELNRWLAATPR